MSLLHRCYSVAPYPLKVAMASARGYYLWWWRYGAETSRLVEEALERERWNPLQWQAWQEKRLAHILETAANKVPYCRQYWNGRNKATGAGLLERLSNWPVLTKEEVRRNACAFLRAGAPKQGLFRSHTSGSTGTPLTVFVSRKALRWWYALFEARWRGWNGVSRFDRWAIVGGQKVVPIERRNPPYWVWNTGLRQLYISAYHMASWSAPAIVDAMRKARVVYLWGYASAMTELAREILRQGLQPPPLRAVISNAEPLLEEQRAILRQAFATRVVNTYGMAEMVAAASECERGTMHLWPEAGVVEVLDENDEPCPPGKVGRLICTGLVNDGMPLVRYEVGDRGALASPQTRCPCGRSLPILEFIEGRHDDVVITPDGRRIGRLDTVFKSDFPIRRAQIVQETLDHLIIKVEPAAGYGPATARAIAEAVRERVGIPMRIEVQPVEEIPLTANGKFRGVISRFAGPPQPNSGRVGSQGNFPL